MKGELYNAPIKNPQKILDLGTGTGIWAIDIAEYVSIHTTTYYYKGKLIKHDPIRKFPQAQVIGNDISAIQPSWVTPNLEFLVEDYEDEWLYKQNTFDFIHARLLSGYVTTFQNI